MKRKKKRKFPQRKKEYKKRELSTYGKYKGYLPYEDAKQFVQRYKITSRGHYWKWLDEVKFLFLPKFPNRVWKKTFVSWNDYLNTDNSFEKTLALRRKNYVPPRPIWDAVRYAQQLARANNINSEPQWYEFYDNNKETIPRDIPKYPWVAYKNFFKSNVGWNVWLGKTIEHIVDAQKNQQRVLSIHQTIDHPANYYQFVLTDGPYKLIDQVRAHQYQTPFRIYKWDVQWDSQLDPAIGRFGFNKGQSIWLVPNINALLFEFDSKLEHFILPTALSETFSGMTSGMRSGMSNGMVSGTDDDYGIVV